MQIFRLRKPQRLALLLALCAVSGSCQQYTTGMQQSLARADEAVVISALRIIALAQQAYSLSNNGEYGTFEQLVDGGYLEKRYRSEQPIKDYKLVMTVTLKAPGHDPYFGVTADPERTGERAGRHYYIGSDTTSIHVNATQTASAADETVN